MSGPTTDYKTIVTRDQYITRACKLCGLLDGRAAIKGDMLEDGIAMIADLTEAWHNEGINLSVNRETTYPMPSYSTVLGTDGSTTYTCVQDHVAAAATCPTTGSLWTDCWKALGTGGSTWASGATYTSPNRLALPSGLMFVKDAFIRDTNGFDTPLFIVPETEWMRIADKFTVGRPARIWIQERPWNERYAWFYPAVPDQTTHVIHINGVYLMGDFTKSDSEIDAPSTARLAFLYDLASLMADLYQRPDLAARHAQRALGYKRNFFRVHQESKDLIVQVMPRFWKYRRRRIR